MQVPIAPLTWSNEESPGLVPGLPHELPPRTVISTRSILSTLDEVRVAAAAVAGSARRLLTIYTHDLEPQVYDHPPFLEVVKRLVLGQRYAKVRVLVVDPARILYESNRFVGLARRLTSHIEIRHVMGKYKGNPASYLIADDCATLYRLQHTRWEGISELNDVGVARSYLNGFDEVWQAAAPDREARRELRR